MNSNQSLMIQCSEIVYLAEQLSEKCKAFHTILSSNDLGYMKPATKQRSIKKQENDEFAIMIREHMELRDTARVLQREFGLLAPPHRRRVKEYLATGNPKVFDGLREKE